MAALLALAAVGFALDGGARLAGPRRAPSPEVLTQRLEGLWGELERAAGAAAEVLSGLDGPELTTESFERLSALTDGLGEGTTLRLLDPDGAIVAWAGEGLLHELGGPGFVREGRAFRAGLTSVSLAAVRALDPVERPWRVMAGRSLSAESLPGTRAGSGPAVRWTVFGPGEAVPAGLVAFGAGQIRGAVRREALETASGGVRGVPAARGAGAVAVAGALLVAGLGAGGGWRLALLTGALAALGLAVGVPARRLLLLLLSVAYAGLVWGPWRERRRRVPAPVAGLSAMGLAAATAAGLQSAAPIDLGSQVWVEPAGAALRLALFAVVAGTLGLARGGLARGGAAGSAPGAEGEPAEGDLGAWLALALTLAAAAVIDRPWIAAVLLAAAGVVAAGHLASRGRPPRAPAAGLLLVSTVLLSAGVWEVVYRERLRWHLETRLAAEAAPPLAGEREQVARRAWRFFRNFDLARVALKESRRLDIQDLGLAVWKESDLPSRGWLSAVVVESWDGRRSSFSYGLPIDDEGELDRSPVLGRRLPPPELLRGALIEGAEALELDGRAWGFVRYWILLRPGFRSAHGRPEELARTLLRGGPDPFEPTPGVFEPARLEIWRPGDAAGEWPEGLSRADLVEGRTVRLQTEAGPAWVHAVPETAAAPRALVLPVLEGLASLERPADQAAGVLLLVAAAAVAGLLLRLGDALQALRLAWRSYTRRLLLVVGALVLLPILALNLLLVRLVSERLQREQLATGRQALESAERILGEYVLTLDPGFGIEAALDDELLVWLSRVARHEINLYWESSVYASSRRELFTAGLLPVRIPGEIQARLTRPGASFAARTNHAGDADYLELYQGVSVPGVAPGPPRLVASMPLLAQQEEVAAEIARVQRRAFLATAALMMLLAAVGARLARGFTKPLMELVRGTQRIAEGAGSLGAHPAELELATLSAAIDSMAERIAVGRLRLLKEKELVERVIDSITSGVISVDGDGRVLLANRVAQRLLGVAVGEPLVSSLGGSERLAPVAGLLAGDLGVPRQSTVRLADAEGEEREWTLVWAPLSGAGEARALLVVEDVTEVLRGQRLEAWAEMARIIAHEIKNPLTPIRLSAEHMRAVRAASPDQFDAVFERCTENILAQVAELQQISTEFQVYSRIPRCEPRPGDLGELVEEVVSAYAAAPPAGVEIEVAGAPRPVPASFDGRLLRRAVRNLVENALRAAETGGRVQVALHTGDGWARIVVADDGPGVPEGDLARIFDPYFSTHDAGTGLGLPIARRIAEEHGGSVRAANRPGGGLEVTISLPLEGREGPGAGS
ncbi:MAG: ATP-binding protein [Thermoanaerobaculia bacterium]|nr:ATP-binding protein [Thermoanaerobaculia bacterium]